MATESVHVNDPSALRALAHPLRLKVLGALRRDGAQTVGMLAERLGAAPGSISYHLTTLATHGFVERADDLARDGRERWWRAAADATHYDPVELAADPDKRDAGVAFQRSIIASYHSEMIERLDRSETDDPAWRDAETLGDTIAWLTVDDARALRDDIAVLAAKWSRRGEHDRTAAGVRAVRFIYAAFPDA